MTLGLIAAGTGSRLRAEGIDLPKGLVPIAGIPLIERTIRSFVSAGITHVSCIVNQESPTLAHFLQQAEFGVPVSLLIRSTQSSLHSLLALAPTLNTERFFLATVDAVYRQGDLQRYVDLCHHRTDNDGVVALTNIIDDDSPLSIDVDPTTFVVRSIGGNVDTSPWISGGLYHFSPRIFDEAERVVASGMERLRTFQSHLITEGYELIGHPFGSIIDVDHRADIVRAETMLSVWQNEESSSQSSS